MKKIVDLDLNLDEFSQEMNDSIIDILSPATNRKMEGRKKIVDMGEDVLPVVHQFLTSKNRELRWEGAKIVQLIASEKSIPHLIQLLNDKELDMRWIASEGLSKIGRASLIPVLSKFIENSESNNYRSSTHHILHKLFTSEEKEKYQSLLHALTKSSAAGDRAVVMANKYLRSYYENKIPERSDQ